MTIAVSTDKNKPTAIWLWCELCVLFIVAPLLLALPVSTPFKLTAVLMALLYVGLLSKRMELFTKQHLVGSDWGNFSLYMVARFILFAVLSTLLVWWYLPAELFSVPLGNPLLWLGVSIFYSVMSVYPQEFLYRLFFFKRYQHLIPNRAVLILFNAAIFSFAHLFFQNKLVFILTFIGGILFALTYRKKRSLMLVSFEHSAYGIWLFTLGLGKMLAFPGA
jgi:membrane protease YdiL (CAAX protease family)